MLGRLKIFLGAAAGVGKTFAMLSEAHEQKERGADVVIGAVETHGRAETERLLAGLERLPDKMVPYRGIELKEFDLDAALVRRPELIVIDELAHSNAPGSRHRRRWQDIEEILDAGIDVFTAVNIQHLESLNDVVAKITGVVVKETVPDAFIERADGIEVVDIPPEELRRRLQEGKVYVPERIETALDGFFKRGNLIALRELALRRAADRVEAEMQSYRAQHGVEGLWPTRDRVLVCIAPNPLATKVVRSAARIGAASHAELHALYVESDRQANRSLEEQQMAREAMNLAETLGMHTMSLSGHDIVGEILAFAQKKNVNLIVVGKPVRARWMEILLGSVVDELVRRSGDIDVHVLTMAQEPRPKRLIKKTHPARPSQIIGAIVTTLVATLICLALYPHVAHANLIMVYLLAVAFVAARSGIVESIVATILSVATFDVMFVPPRGTFQVADTEYLITFGVMLVVALLISTLTLRLRNQAEASSDRERRTAALYSLSKELAKSRTKREIATAGLNEIRALFDVDSAIMIADAGKLSELAPSVSGFEREPSEAAVAAWCLEHNSRAGAATDTLPGSKGLYIPLRGTSGALGVLALGPQADPVFDNPAQLNLLETLANSLGMALERTILAKESHEARIQAESEKMRNALLSSISHDLRTPLTSIAGAASSLSEGRGDVKALAGTIYQESMRLNLQVQNLLDMTRLRSGEVTMRNEWNSVEEIVGTSIARARELLKDRRVKVTIPADLPLVFGDGELLEKVVVNVLENVAKHTPEGTPVEVNARLGASNILLDVADEGPGIPKGEETKIFERFFQTGDKAKGGGFGLGLAISRAILRLHDGQIWAENRRDKQGAIFHIEIPRRKQPEVPGG